MRLRDSAHMVLQRMWIAVWTTPIRAGKAGMTCNVHHAIPVENAISAIDARRETSVKHCRVVRSNRPRQRANAYRGLTPISVTETRLP